MGVSLRAGAESLPDAAGGAPLEVFASFVGKSWESGEPGGAFHDVSKWEWGVPGRVLVVSHSVNNGVYSGVTVIHVDASTGRIVGRYATSASFHTDGVFEVTEDGFKTTETVTGDAGGITEVKSGMTFKDGEMHVWSQYLKDGVWSDIEERVYREMVS